MSFLSVNWKAGKITEQNPCGLNGVDFIEYFGPDEGSLETLFVRMGFIQLAKMPNRNIRLFRQGDINFILNAEAGTFAAKLTSSRGPAVTSIGLRVGDAALAFHAAIERGAVAYDGSETSRGATPFLAIYGIGDTLIYFIDEHGHRELYQKNFGIHDNSVRPMGLGLQSVDHVTNNVPAGELNQWSEFYRKIFNFREARFFDIKGESTGLVSKIMRSPCGQFCVPINEPTGAKSQIQEYLDEYKGSGIQQIALLTDNIVPSLEKLKSNQVEFLNGPAHPYYEALLDRLPAVTEDLARLERNAVLVDGDENGYLLQAFTKNSIGPLFFEVVQRKGHDGFANGNFQALFNARENDQRERGYIE